MAEDADTLETKMPGNFPTKTAVIAIVFLVIGYSAAYFMGAGASGDVTATFGETNVISADDAADKAFEFIENNLLEPGVTATLGDVVEENDMYKAELTISQAGQSKNAEVWITKDGSKLFISPPIELDEQPQQTEFDAPDSTVPEVELYVMSFCPYGMAAEEAVKPVMDLLGSGVDFSPRFILTATTGGCQYGNPYKGFCSLHGEYETIEDERQLCIIDEYGMDTWWDYVIALKAEYDKRMTACQEQLEVCGEESYCRAEFNSCYTSAIEDSWQAAVDEVGLDAARINSCMSTKGSALLAAEAQNTAETGVSGSPHMIINGEDLDRLRPAAEYQAAICSGFTNPPAGCAERVSAAGSSTPSGSC